MKESGLSAVGNGELFGGLKQGSGVVKSRVWDKILPWLGLKDGQAGDARQGAKDEAIAMCL